MDRYQLRNFLDREGISRNAYAFGRPGRDEQSVLSPIEGGWTVYYWERGLKTSVKEFETEDEACRYLFDILVRDPTARC
ncbi:MAG: hypothetical protein GEU78_19310 [Actinobacteria bacterium]|nr:hypothetical protein [Actinomycetota bacterium]